jgi:hypothetical protein
MPVWLRVALLALWAVPTVLVWCGNRRVVALLRDILAELRRDAH